MDYLLCTGVQQCSKLLLLHGRLLPQVSSRSACLTLSFSGFFQIFSILDVWEGTGKHRQASHLASLKRSHIPLQHRPASAEPPLICLRSGGLVVELVKP